MSRQSPADRAVDTGVVVVLTSVLLLGFLGTFADPTYLVGAFAGLACVVWIVLVVDYYDKGPGVLLVCVLPAYVLLGAMVGVRTTSSYLRLPSSDALVGVLTATIGASNQLLTTIPPVDTVGDATLVPYAIGFLAAGASLWIALRGVRPIAPLVPMLIALAVATLLGTQQRELLALQAAVFAGVSLWWVALRGARRLEVVRDRGRGPRAVGAALLVVVVGAAVPQLLPEPADGDPDRVVLRGRIGSGYDVAALSSPLSSFRRFTKQPAATSIQNVHDQRLLRVTGLPEGQAVRFVALDEYDGVTWHADNRTVAGASDDLFLRIGSEVGALRQGRAVEVGVEVTKHYLSNWMPLAGQLTGVFFVYLDGRAQRVDVRYNPATTTAVVIGGLAEGDDYLLSGVLPGTRLREGAQGYATTGPLQPRGAFLDEPLEPWATSGLTPLAQVRSLAKYLRANGRFSDGADLDERKYTPGHDSARLGEGFFLAPQIVGDEEQYAAFLALAANRLGVPARVVIGAVPGRGGWVEGRHVSAWVEVRVSDGSWRTLPTEDFMSTRPPKRTDPPRELPEDFLEQPQEQERPQDEVRPPSRGEESAEAAAAAESGDAGGPSGSLPFPWWVPVVLLLVWSVPLLKLVRRRRRAWAGSASARIAGAWREVLDLATDLGRPVPAGLPRVDQAQRLGLDPATAMGVQDSLFSRGDPGPERASEVWTRTGQQRRELTRGVGRVRRTWSLWNPSSLVPSRFRRRGGPGPLG